MTTRIMADIETLGTAPGSVILSIGAVKFNAREVYLDTFYQVIDPKSCTGMGLTMDPDTVMWWMQQSDEARKALFANPTGAVTLARALVLFTEWVLHTNRNPDNVEVWGNGANFDNALLGAAYRACGLEQPWKFYNDRCYRTVKALHPNIKMAKRIGTHHNALDDARSQAEHLIQLPSFQTMCSLVTENV